VSGTLFAVEYARYRATLERHPGGDGAAGIVEESFEGCDRLAERSDQVVALGHKGIGKRHVWLRCAALRTARPKPEHYACGAQMPMPAAFLAKY
jgi:hypothetical protein